MQSQMEIENWLKEHKITEVECLVPDMTGNARGKFIPAKKFLKEDSRLPEGILAQTVTGEFSDNYWELLGTIDGDMLLEPDPSTARIVPWANETTGQIIHDCHTKDGKPHPFSTRAVLKHILELYREEGLQPVIAPEMEFYLVEKNTNPDMVLKPPLGRSGRPETARQSYSIDAANEFEPFVEDMYAYGEAMGLDIDTLIHESGAAQLEVNFIHGDPLNLADQVFTFKRMVREVALKHNIYATFMAKPMASEPGSAKHIHQSILSAADGRNIFSTADGEYSQAFYHYLGGLQKYTPYVMSFFAPNVNSYRRFTREVSAPINLHWGFDNRTTGLRVPDANPKNYRIENRFPGADVNPYLSIAATLACGYLGMKNKIEPSAAYQGNAYEEELALPRTLEEALRGLREDKDIAELFGEKFIELYTSIKLVEFEEFNHVISSWEREHLLLNV
ncbi:MAG: glutamine synthetase [Porticoccaceae bacterium]|jgi:glutamine synthetase|nr:glutamine synthetase [Porticoccaceae bacterium]MBT6319778.1 glutamine synthetase [Porticoccaceae bacterium]MBT7904399.1 glutamine synthetase [Porticoccaceae bacterium]